MAETFNEAVEILGIADETQLLVRGHNSQDEPLQVWQDNNADPKARLYDDGSLQLGGDFSGSRVAYLEANADGLASAILKQGIQSRGRVGGAVSSADAFDWSVHELRFDGSGEVEGQHSALRGRIEFANTTASHGSTELRAGHFVAINTSSAVLAKAIGLDVAVSNAGGGSITQAYGIRVANMPQSSDYAIHTGTGRVHFGGNVGIGVAAPTAKLHVVAESGVPLRVENGDASASLSLSASGVFQIVSSQVSAVHSIANNDNSIMRLTLNNFNAGIETGSILQLQAGSITPDNNLNRGQLIAFPKNYKTANLRGFIVQGVGAPLRFRVDSENSFYWQKNETILMELAPGSPTTLSVYGSINLTGAFAHTGSTVGFYGATPTTKLTVTGSRDGNAALASLLTALDNLGLITNSSTA